MPSLQVKVLESKVRDRSKPISRGDGKGFEDRGKGKDRGCITG